MPLKNLLLKYKIGQWILTYYETENELQENFRNKLCNIIISDIEHKNTKYVSKHYLVYIIIIIAVYKIFKFLYRLTNDLADPITKMIVSTFSTEVETTYYVAPISKKDSVAKRSVIARGKLMNKWRNRCTLNKKFENKLQKKETNKKKENGMFIYTLVNTNEFWRYIDLSQVSWTYC